MKQKRHIHKVYLLKLVNEPISVGIDPVNLLLSRYNDSMIRVMSLQYEKKHGKYDAGTSISVNLLKPVNKPISDGMFPVSLLKEKDKMPMKQNRGTYELSEELGDRTHHR